MDSLAGVHCCRPLAICSRSGTLNPKPPSEFPTECHLYSNLDSPRWRPLLSAVGDLLPFWYIEPKTHPPDFQPNVICSLIWIRFAGVHCCRCIHPIIHRSISGAFSGVLSVYSPVDSPEYSQSIPRSIPRSIPGVFPGAFPGVFPEYSLEYSPEFSWSIHRCIPRSIPRAFPGVFAKYSRSSHFKEFTGVFPEYSPEYSPSILGAFPGVFRGTFPEHSPGVFTGVFPEHAPGSSPPGVFTGVLPEYSPE